MTTTMANSMTDNDNEPLSPERVRRGRRVALLLFVIGFGPMLLATVMYYTGWLNPAGHVNYGSLVQPLVPVSQLNLIGTDGKRLADRFTAPTANRQWLMLTTAEGCAQTCESLLYLSRQVNVALGKDANRVARAAYLTELTLSQQQRLGAEYEAVEMLRRGGRDPVWPDAINPAAGPRILLVDPLGHVMMQYTPDNSGEDMLKDIKRLLKLSQLG
ncbi:hypothetical protein [Marinobacter mobilis]|uniref:Cytochrome oxidase Cu insertion factor, SCO1/SenC/PrrC family n=1 Tax=Marinobacter mobilis TaxID=488533 RepID=A0A1H2W9U4_9GAMM|nr:hypothetical protein [Marinobacter mobilis]SDW77311.1 hypothetical protein SAMN04487960_10495 [Marinobacter mobilis]SDX54211.1 hypothetical protein SAMN04487960_110194 [Marinobacter mobilis]